MTINPILQKLNNSNNALGMLAALKNGNPDAMFAQLMKSNPQFNQFVQQNQGRTPDQICQAYGIDPALISQFMK